MVFYHFCWPGAISLSSSKYQKPGYVVKEYALPEKRMNLVEEIERNMASYVEMRKEFAECKEAMEKQEQKKREKMERFMQTGWYKSPERNREVDRLSYLFATKKLLAMYI
eukprot:TRINITY_DN1377_c0_g2_i4.p1 TRINITY_DN1377_c0_g2~~TRINITY_DN1377_c0_g2_i4.p1  ORF type:complete len:110 (+),score=34.43 TRINITY_DN1377_c0_g2_i4:225-554(+)